MCLFALLLLPGAPLAFATTYYVASNGADTAAGTTPQTAWRTVGRANQWLAHAGAGDRLLLHGGDRFQDEFLRCEHPDNSQDAEALQAEGGCGGSAAAPLFVGSYGQGRPLVDGADDLHLAWRKVGNGVFAADLRRTPAKLYVDSGNVVSPQLLPVPNATGEYSEQRAYHFLDLVGQGGRLYVHGAMEATTGVPPSADQTWVQVGIPGSSGKAQSFSATGSGLDNVRSIAGSWFTDGTTIWLHLPDGSDPSRHTIAGTYRRFGMLLVSARNVTVEGLAFAHQQQSSIFAVAYADAPERDGVGPNENLHLLHNRCSHFGDLVTARFPLRHEANYLEGCIVITASGDCHPHLLRGILVDGNEVGTFDGYLGTGQFLEAGIVVSGIDGGGAKNLEVITHNKVHTHAARGILYGNTSLSTCGGEGMLNEGGTVGWNELTDNQGNLFFTQTLGGRVTGNVIHHSYGEGVQAGGGSRSTPEQPQIFDYNVIAFVGRSASEALYNGFDCNGSPVGVEGAYWRKNTVYDTNSAAITLENGCGGAHVEDNIFDMKALRFPENDEVNSSYLMYFVESSHSPDTVFRNNLWINGSNPQPFHSSASGYTCEDFLTQWPDRKSLCSPDAGFVAQDRGDFHLSSHSVARGKATDGGNLGALP